MGSINVEYNGKSIPIANVGIVSSKEKTILGNPERDLILQTLGSIQVQVGNKFYELPFSLNNGSSSALNIKSIESIDSLNIDGYPDGTFIYDQKSGALYLVYNRKLIIISGEDSDNDIFLSYINDQTLTGLQKNRLVLNAGQFLNSLQDVKRFTYEDVYDGMIIFANDEKTHYILMNSQHPNELSSWETFYIGSQGGVIKNGLVIKNQTRENLLFLNEIDPIQNNIFNGLKIGSNEKWMKTSVNTADQTLINYNTPEFVIKNQSIKILHVLNNNVGIRGDASGSDSYNVMIYGTTKLNDTLFTDKKVSSTDFNTINITHWDGGKGFALTHGSDNKWNLEIDNLVVRDSLVANKMILKELEVERAYATGGHMLVTDGAVINSYYYRLPTPEEVEMANVTHNGNYGTLDASSYYYFVTFKESTEKDDNDAYVSLPTTPALPSGNELTNNVEKDTLDVDKNCPFIAGDVLLCQTASGLMAKKYYAYVSYSTNKYIAIKSNHIRNNAIYQRDNEGNPVSIFKDFSIESNDALIRITNTLVDNQGIYKYKNRRRFIDIDGTRNQITMYDNLGNPNLFSGSLNENGFYDDISIITGIEPGGSLKLRMGELSDLQIPGLTGYGLYADNVYLKGKLIVKDSSGEYPIGANKGTWVNGNTNTYSINDIITYNGSAYRCIVDHTNTVESQAVPGISDFWEIFVEKGSDGSLTQDFTSVEIIGEQVFIYDKISSTYDKTNIPLNATLKGLKPENITEAKFQWKINDNIIYETIYTDEQITTDRLINSVNIYPVGINSSINWDTIWGTNKTISIYCYVYLNQSITDSYYDVISINKLSDGIDGSGSVNAFLTNDSHSIPTDSSGNNPNFSGASSKLYIYNGGVDDTANWTITFIESGVSGTKAGSTYTVTGISVDSGYVDFVANRTGYSQITKRFDVKKLKSGTTGSSPTVYEMIPSFYTWSKDSNDALNPSNITFQFNKTVGNTTTSFSGYYINSYSTDGSSFSQISVGTGTLSTIAINKTYKAIRCTLYDQEGGTQLDYQTAMMVSDGKDAYTIVLSNEALTVPCLADGTFASGTFSSPYKYYTDVTVYKGATKLLRDSTNGWGIDMPSGGTVALSSQSVDAYTFRFNITGFTGAASDLSGVGLIRIYIYTGVYLSATYTFNKTLSLSKAQQGPLLDWIKEWDGASSYMDTYKIISPRMFAGTKNGSTYTGVAIGRDVFGLGSNGIAGFYNSVKTFGIDASTGNCIFGNGDNSISYTNNGVLSFGKNVALNWNSGYANLIWKNESGAAFFNSPPGYKYTYSQLITTSGYHRITLRKTVKVAGWYSVSFWYNLATSSSFTFNVQINDHNAVSITETGAHDWKFASGSVYVTSYLTLGFIDFEGVPSGAQLYISDLMVVEGKNIPQTYTPPMTYVDANGIYTGTLTATQVNAVEINAESITVGKMSVNRLKIDSTLIVGGTSGAESYDGVISVLNANSTPTEVVRLDRTGLKAIAGTIAGFTISGESLVNTGFSNDAAIYFRNDSAGIISAFGGNVLPAITGTRCLLSLQNHESTGAYGSDNYGAIISVKNSLGKNIALKAIGAIQASTLMSDTIATWVMGSTSTWVPSLHSLIIITAYQNYSLELPTQTIIGNSFGYSTIPSNFGFVFTLHCKFNCGYTITIQPPSGVNLYNQNGANSTFAMGAGDTATILCTKEGGTFRYEILSRYYD